MKAIVLVGGFGTRLKSVVSDLPKPMAPIDNKPFLAYLLQYLQQQGVTEVILTIHYMGEKIRDYFKNEFASLKIHYVEETESLGTGGAIVNALNHYKFDEPVIILNGDTFVKIDYQRMYQEHLNTEAEFTMALSAVEDCARYGNVITDNGYVTRFAEKGKAGPGNINAGVYVIKPGVFRRFKLPQKFSIESDFLLPYIKQIKPRAFATEQYFIDIGIPDDYARACKELPMIAEKLECQLNLPYQL